MFPYPTCPFRFCNPWSNRSDNENIGMTAPLNRVQILLWSTWTNSRKGFHFKFDCQGAASDIITVTWPQLLVARRAEKSQGTLSRCWVLMLGTAMVGFLAERSKGPRCRQVHVQTTNGGKFIASALWYRSSLRFSGFVSALNIADE